MYETIDCYEICGDQYDFLTFGCDDGNSHNYDGCSDCEIDDGYYCVNGAYLPGYQGYAYAYEVDTCYEICGDGYNLGTYACDDGDSTDLDGCDSDCVIEDGWYCYGGDNTGPDVCYETCGDGINRWSYPDACDDGNYESGDGCDEYCVIEDHWGCDTNTYDVVDECYETCGDGYFMGWWDN
jgi:cysteine-rich repeat protein